jgi:hypothetical protein
MKRDRLHDAVALVENAEHRDTLRHGGHAALARGCGGDFAGHRRRGVLLLLRASARRERQREQQWCGQRSHVYSGIQGS